MSDIGVETMEMEGIQGTTDEISGEENEGLIGIRGRRRVVGL